MMKVVCILILLLPPITFGQVRISEVCPRNNTLIDTNGNTPDWIEIHNYSASPVNLLGWYLSDNDNAPQKWSFPDTTILANGYMLVFADGSNQIVNNELHANFKVNGDGEHLYLYQNDSLHQTTPSVCVPQNFSLVVEWNNSSVFWDSIPTPEALSVNHYPIPSDTLSWSLQSGFVQKNVPLFITSSLGLDVHFVQERKDVNYLDAIYSPSAFVWEKDNRLSEISTGDDWEFPEEVPLITTISARTFVETCPVSPLTIRTYVDMESDFTQENIVSLQINPTDFFGSKGIYVNGNYWNRGKNWERNAYLTYIENDSVLIESEVGTRITGSGSRANPQKSLRLYFREQFTENTSANYYFEDRDSTLSYKRLVLRATGSDFTGSLVRDALFTNLLKHSGIDYLSASPCIVFINGEYWGIHFIKEYSNPYLLGARHSIDPNEINIIENQGNTTEGSDYLWQEVASFLKNESLELPESYAWISERVDIENLCEYLVFQDLAANWDVTKNNVKIWYSNESDAKIRFIAFDGDATHYRLDYDLIDFLLNDDDSNILSLLFQKLWENRSFQSKLSATYGRIIGTLPLDKIDSDNEQLMSHVSRQIHAHQLRWLHPKNIDAWQKEMDRIRGFLQLRKQAVFNNLARHTKGILVFPNPASVVIRADIPIGSHVEICDLMGQPIRTTLYNGEIPVDFLPEGSFLLRYFIGNVIQTTRFTIVR